MLQYSSVTAAAAKGDVAVVLATSIEKVKIEPMKLL